MDTLLHDLRYAARQLLKAPGFTLVAVLTLGLGIGATSTLFNVVNGVFLRPRGYAEPERLMDVYLRSKSLAFGSMSYPDYRDLRERSRVFADAMLYRLGSLGYGTGDEIRTIWAETVTGNYFDVLGVKPWLGRTFDPARDDVDGAPLVVVVSHQFWTRMLGADPAAVGKAIRLNGQPFTVIGIAPPSFGGMVRGLVPGVWLPASAQTQLYPGTTILTDRANHSGFVKARLKPGATVEQGREDLDAVGRELATEYPATNAGLTFAGVPTSSVVINPMIDGSITGAAVVLLAIPALVLLIVCANLATLQLTRAAGRQREFAVRLALGAGRRRMIRQLLTENVLLALVGGAVGLLLVGWSTRALVAFQPPIPLPLSLDLAIDWRVIAFTAAVAMLAGVGFGVIPAARASRVEVALDLHEGRVGGGRRRSRLRGLLLAGQLTVSVLLLVAAGLLVRGLAGAQRIDLGFKPDHAAMVQFDLAHQRFDGDEGRRFIEQALARLATEPGLVAVSITNRAPLDLNLSSDEVRVEGRSYQGDDRPPLVQVASVGPAYFRTIGAGLVAGREFAATDRRDAPKVAVVNETAARQLWPGQEALGKRFTNGFDTSADPWYQVVGVVHDVKVNTPGEAPTAAIYYPVLQRYDSYLTLIARTAGDAGAALPRVLAALKAVDPGLSVIASGPLTDRVVMGLWPARFATGLLMALGLVGLAIACLGLYGAIAHGVTQRTRELGIRLALGANVRDVVSLVLREGMSVVVVGLGVGLMLAALGSRLLAAWLYGVSPWDPLAFVVAPAMLAAVAFLACYVPARRATRVDPVQALRSE
jgi:putative ABC transport system permease protein